MHRLNMWLFPLKISSIAAVTYAASTVPRQNCATAIEASASICCSALASQAQLLDNVYYPNSTEYVDRMDSYWSVSAAVNPWCIAQPTEAEDVSTIIKTLVANSCPFGIRGGGHGAWNGSNSVIEGVTVDFGYINATTYNSTTKIASVRPGGHWQDVYDVLSPQGVTVAGGRAGTVGVGGFISGGGNSFYSSSHGMACDTVQNFEVVLANGSIVNANAEENADLWKALKGGSGNFGLITRFDMYAIEFPDASNPEIWGGLLGYDLSAGDDLLDALVDFNNNVPNDQNTSSILWWASLPTGWLLNVALENTLGTENPPAVQGYLNVSGLTSNTMARNDLTNISRDLGAGQPAGYRNDWWTLLLKNDADVLKYVVETHKYAVQQLNETMSADSEFNTLAMFQPINHLIAQHGIDAGGNVMGLDNALNGENGIMFLAAFAANGEENEAKAIPIMQNWTDSIVAHTDSIGASLNWHYLNYAYETQDPLATFGADAIATMKAVSSKYDPNGVFQKLRSSGFKLPA